MMMMMMMSNTRIKKKFVMKYANSANGLCQLFGIGALLEYMYYS